MIKKATIDRIEGNSVRSARPYQVKDHMYSQQLHLLQLKEDMKPVTLEGKKKNDRKTSLPHQDLIWNMFLINILA